MKNILLSLIVIVTVASLGAVGTYTSFVDTEVSEGNSWQAGSLELQLGDSVPYPNDDPQSSPYDPDEDYGEDPLGDSVEATWDHTLGYPGGMDPGVGHTLTSRVKLQNWGTIEATSLDIACVNVNTAPDTGPLDKDTKMIITHLVYYNGPTVNLLDMLKTAASKTTVTLDDWESYPFTGLTPPPLNSQAFLDMTVEFGDADNSYQGARTNMTLIFTLQ